MFDILEADVVILQETKIQRKDLTDDMVLVPGWDSYFSLPKHEKGKFGVVIYTRQATCAPIRAEEGLTGILCPPNTTTPFRELPENQQIGGYPTPVQALEAPNAQDIAADFTLLDSEGRCVILEFPAFVLLGLYNPATRDESRDAFRISFLNLLDLRIRNLVKAGKRVVVCGDLNVSKAEIDTANLAAELRKMGSSIEEHFSRPSRRWFNHLLEDGTVWGERDAGREQPVLYDICRGFHPERTGMYTHWETKINARPGNYGSRIDYILCTLDMKDWFVESNIQEGLMGSDHCPVYAVIRDTVSIDGHDVDVHDVMNPEGMFLRGKRQRKHATRDILPTSARLIPEFSGRRSIKDMFFGKPRENAEPVTTPAAALGPPTRETASSLVAETSSASFRDDAGGSQNQSLSQPLSQSTSQSQVSESDDALVSNLRKTTSPATPDLRSGSAKRNKATAASTEKGQKSLKGFFQSKVISVASETTSPQTDRFNVETTGLKLEDGGNKGDPSALPDRPTKRAKLDPVNSDTPDSIKRNAIDLSTPHNNASALGAFPDHDPIESKDRWTRLFAKPAAPRCEGHQEPCKTMTTKKPGVNCGRAFWICARPLGPTGEKETGTRWRCGTFIWASDWTATSGE